MKRPALAMMAVRPRVFRDAVLPPAVLLTGLKIKRLSCTDAHCNCMTRALYMGR